MLCVMEHDKGACYFRPFPAANREQPEILQFFERGFQLLIGGK